MTPRRSWRALSLLCFALLVAHQVAAKSNKDDRNWGLPSKNTSSSKKNDSSSSSSSSKKKNQSKKEDKKKQPDPPADDDDDDPSGNNNNSSSDFKASFTFFPQSDFTSNINAFLNSNNEEKKEALQKRLQEFVREKMVDHDEVDKQVKRTRKEWEDLNIEQHMKAIEVFMKMGSFLLRSPPIQKLMSSREAQESLRQFVLSIKLLLEDPERSRVYGDSDQWQAMFDKLKKWEGASQESLLETLIEYLEHQSDND